MRYWGLIILCIIRIYCSKAQSVSPLKITISTNKNVIGTHIDTILLAEVYDDVGRMMVTVENISNKPVIINETIYGYHYINNKHHDNVSFKIYYRKNHESKYVECEYQDKQYCIIGDEEYTKVLQPGQKSIEYINSFRDAVFKGAGEYKIYCLYRMPMSKKNRVIQSNTIYVQYKPLTINTDDNSFILKNRAIKAYELGDYVLSGIIYQRLIANERLNTEWYYRLGQCYMKVKNYEGAHYYLSSASYNSFNIEYRKAYISLLKEMNKKTELDIEFKELSQMIQSADSFKNHIMHDIDK